MYSRFEEAYMESPWPFEDLENVAVFTTKRVIFDGQPILYVFHDEEDGGWQFLDDGPNDADAAALVSLKHITIKDPTLLNLAKLPIGWYAWRTTPEEAWQTALNR